MCVSVRNGIMLEIYEFTHSLRTFLTYAGQMYGFTHCLRTFWPRPAHGAIAMEYSEDIGRRQARERIPRNRRYRITVTGDDFETITVMCFVI